MAKVYVHPEEGFENALKRFQRYVDKDGTIGEYKRKTSFTPKRQKRQKLWKKGRTA